MTERTPLVLLDDVATAKDDSRVFDVAVEEHRLARLRQGDMARYEKDIRIAEERWRNAKIARDNHLRVQRRLGVKHSEAVARLVERRKEAGYDDERVDGLPITVPYEDIPNA